MKCLFIASLNKPIGYSVVRTTFDSGFTLIELMLAVIIVGVLTALAMTAYTGYRDNININNAKANILVIDQEIQRYYTVNAKNPNSLNELAGKIPTTDPWGTAYQYLNVVNAKNKGAVRKDKKLNPLNSDYDLYSMGKDGKSQKPLTAKDSWDDVIRANNGAYVGLAKDY